MMLFLFRIAVFWPVILVFVALSLLLPSSPLAQIPPSDAEAAAYDGLHRAAHVGDVDTIRQLVRQGADLEARDGANRTPAHVAAYASHEEALKVLAAAGADMNALEHQDYDLVTIAAVANDLDMLETALALGNSPDNITSLYEGTALIAAAHLGHHEVVKTLIEAGAPLDHVNNLHWTALIEAVILGDGGGDHQLTVRHLVEAGADSSLADRNGVTPLQHAQNRGYTEMIELLQ